MEKSGLGTRIQLNPIQQEHEHCSSIILIDKEKWTNERHPSSRHKLNFIILLKRIDVLAPWEECWEWGIEINDVFELGKHVRRMIKLCEHSIDFSYSNKNDVVDLVLCN